MKIRIQDLKLRPDHTQEDLSFKIRRVLQIKSEPFQYQVIRRSIDARKKPEMYYIYTVDVSVANPERYVKNHKKRGREKISLIRQNDYKFPYEPEKRGTSSNLAPVIAGSGPSGLFCALMLARAGECPIVLERGQRVEERQKTVEEFWRTGRLNPNSNVQFGEGGAGTFSDGKLNTLIKDPDGRIRFVLETFVRAGADPEILWEQKPHIGTDVLTSVVRNLREEIISLGGQFLFESCLTGLTLSDSGEWIVEINQGESFLKSSHVILAVGHSARDTLRTLHRMELKMEPKSFAVGLRTEHPQSVINESMYGKNCPYELGAAPYKVTHKCADGRGVYSFCMCPGGYVVNASSQEGRLAVNGMSYHDRGGENANSAIVVTVSPDDYKWEGPLAGMLFQERLEEKAFALGEGRIPLQRFEDFCENRPTVALGRVLPQMKGGFSFANLRSLLPEALNLDLIEAMQAFGKKIPGFSDPDVLFSGVESRTSSPVRICRDENCHGSLPGIYPCGEGAGYAGGITSAAVDGIRVAEAVCRDLRTFGG